MFRGQIIGGKCGRDTPGYMPNPEVKPASVDGTIWGTYGRVDRCQYRLQKRGSCIIQLPLFAVRTCLHPSPCNFYIPASCVYALKASYAIIPITSTFFNKILKGDVIS